MINLWKIDLSTNRELQNHYREQGKLYIADSIDHTESTYEGKTIALLTLKDLVNLKQTSPETVLISIFGEEVLAKDCDEDTRFGYVAFGTVVKG